MNTAGTEWVDLVVAELAPASLRVQRTRWMRLAGVGLIVLGVLGVVFSPSLPNLLVRGPATALIGIVIALSGFWPVVRLRSRMKRCFPDLETYPRLWDRSTAANYLRWTERNGLPRDVMSIRRQAPS